MGQMTPRKVAARTGAVLALLGVLALVFALYTRPAFLVTLADQVWACF